MVSFDIVLAACVLEDDRFDRSLSNIEAEDTLRHLFIPLLRSIERLQEHELSITATDGARDWLGNHGYDAEFGARPLRRLVQTEVEDRLSDAVLAGKFTSGDVVQIDVEDDAIVLKQETESAVPTT